MASNLQGFLNKFNSPEGYWVNKIDTLQTFDIKATFFPQKPPQDSKKQKQSFLSKAINKVENAIEDAAKEALSNATGGLLGTPNIKGTVVDKKGSNDGNISFIDYLIKGNLLNNNEENEGIKAELDLSFYVQNIDIPQLETNSGELIETNISQFPLNGGLLKPTSNEFTLHILNTKASIAERIFYPWMREVTLPYWVYDYQPYTTANIEIDFSKHNDMKYLFVGCRPKQIESLKPSNELGNVIRSVTIIFDYMFINSSLKRADEKKDKLKQMGKDLLGGASKIFGL